jgi:hypothetical protein
VDTQADFSAVPMTIAQREGIPYATDHPGEARGLVGTVAKFRDRIRVVIAGQEHDWPCDFVDAPAVPRLPELPPVLGRAGFLGDYAVTIDSGYLIIVRLGPIRRWWRKRLHFLWQAFGLVRSTGDPL